MHTFECGMTIFHYNSDLSGDVLLKDSDGGASYNVPGCELLAFFADWMTRQAEDALDSRVVAVSRESRS